MRIVHNFALKIKYLVNTLNRKEDLFIALVIVFVGIGGFGLGRLSGIEKGEVRIYNAEEASIFRAVEETSLVQGSYVASVNGTRYHAPWCSGASSIKEENKIWFDSKEEAERAGYTPAANCKGL